MAIIKISELDELTTPAAGDNIPIDDISEALPADQTKRITFANLVTAAITAAISALSYIYRRQGGSATVWDTGGTNNYTPTAPKIQAGSYTGSKSTSASATFTITFPVAFSYAPLVFVTEKFYSITNMTWKVSSVSATQAVIRVDDPTSSGVQIDFNWLAIGE